MRGERGEGPVPLEPGPGGDLDYKTKGGGGGGGDAAGCEKPVPPFFPLYALSSCIFASTHLETRRSPCSHSTSRPDSGSNARPLDPASHRQADAAGRGEWSAIYPPTHPPTPRSIDPPTPTSNKSTPRLPTRLDEPLAERGIGAAAAVFQVDRLADREEPAALLPPVDAVLLHVRPEEEAGGGWGVRTRRGGRGK